MARALVALGSNVGDRASFLRDAIARLETLPDVAILAASGWREYPAIGGPDEQPAYLNAALLLETLLEPEVLLTRLLRIEDELGRRRDVRWDRRTIDLDLLLHGSQIRHSPLLELPHPRMAVRRFALEPAAEIAGTMVHPTIGWSLNRLLDHLQRAVPYAAILGLAGSGKTELAKSAAKAIGGTSLESPKRNAAASKRPGSDLAVEIEFLRSRQELLASQRWDASNPWTLSDFWIEQSLAYASARLTPDAVRVLEEQLLADRSRIVPPKVTVLLETPLEDRADLPDADEATAARTPALERLAAELECITRRPDLGPVLRLSARDLPRALQELAAALDAMR